MSFETTKGALASEFPGFPPFIHHIMAKYEMGMSKDEIIAEMKSAGIANAIDDVIHNVNKTHVTFDETRMTHDTRDVVEVVEEINRATEETISMVEKNNKTLANMILSAIDKEEELENQRVLDGVSRGN